MSQVTFRAAVVSCYSFDYNACVVLCRSEKEAIRYLRQVYKEETEIDESSGHEFESEISEDGCYCKIINYRKTGETDISEWRVVPNIYTWDGMKEERGCVRKRSR